MMTKPRFLFLTLSLLAVLLVSACAPAASAPTAAPTSPPDLTLAAGAGVLPATSTPDSSSTLPATATLEPPTLAVPTPTVQFIPTSRGPDLEATDPAAVALASGGLQLVEFFRFT